MPFVISQFCRSEPRSSMDHFILCFESHKARIQASARLPSFLSWASGSASDIIQVVSWVQFLIMAVGLRSSFLWQLSAWVQSLLLDAVSLLRQLPRWPPTTAVGQFSLSSQSLLLVLHLRPPAKESALLLKTHVIRLGSFKQSGMSS